MNRNEIAADERLTAAPTTPCVGVCRIDESSGVCLGCARTRAEIGSWRTAAPESRREVWADLPRRRAALGLDLHRLDWTTDDIRAFVARTMRSEGGTWVGGVYGAIAEFCVGPKESIEVRDRGCLIAVTARAAIRICISNRVRALSFADGKVVMLVVPREKTCGFGTPAWRRLAPTPRQSGRRIELDISMISDSARYVRASEFEPLTWGYNVGWTA